MKNVDYPIFYPEGAVPQPPTNTKLLWSIRMFIQPHLDNSSQTFRLKKDIKLLENVQRRSTKIKAPNGKFSIIVL